jgi:hypothetical protein
MTSSEHAEILQQVASAFDELAEHMQAAFADLPSVGVENLPMLRVRDHALKGGRFIREFLAGIPRSA